MRNDDDLRHYMPLLRRIVILVAVLTAVPVILWTITAFVRSYVGPPQVPSYRAMPTGEPPAADMAATVQHGQQTNQPGSQPATQDASAQAPAAAASAARSDPLPAMVQARATMTDAASGAGAVNPPASIDTSAPASGIAMAAPGAPMVTNTTAAQAHTPAKPPMVAAVSPASPAAMPAAPTVAPAMPGGDVKAPVAPAPQAASAAPDMKTPAAIAAATPGQPAAAMRPADDDAVPAAQPLAGPIPLPRHRPRYFAMAQIEPATAGVAHGIIPLPRQRPEDAGPPAAAPAPPPPGPLDFLQNIFQPHQ